MRITVHDLAGIHVRANDARLVGEKVELGPDLVEGLARLALRAIKLCPPPDYKKYNNRSEALK